MSESLASKWFPELDLFPTPEERRLAERQFVWTSTGRGFWFGLLTFVYVSIGSLMGSQLAAWLDPRAGPWYYVIRCLSFVLIVLSGGVGGVWLYSASTRRRLREELNRRGIAVCMKCGYDLRGQVEQRCPECGTTMVPTS